MVNVTVFARRLLKQRRVLVMAAVIAVGGSLLALPSPPPSQSLRFDFSKDAQGWEPLPSASAAALSTVEDETAPARRALEVRYRVAKGQVVGVRRTVKGADGAGLRLHVKTERATTIVVGMIEGDGSAYNKPIETREGQWMPIVVPFADLALADDAKDENNRLDPGQVRALVIIDAAGFLSSSTGERRMWLANYETISQTDADAGAAAAIAAAAEWTFETEPEGWTAIPPPGGTAASVSVTPVKGSAAAGAGALRVSYRVEKKKVSGVLRRIDGFGGVGVRAQVFTPEPAMLVLGLIERDGSSYNLPVRTTGGEWQDIDVLLQNFSLADDSKDENRRLDARQVHVLVVADAAGFLGDAEGAREFLVGNYTIVSKEAAARSRAGDGPRGFVPLRTTGVPTTSGARATSGITYVPGKFEQAFLANGPGELVAVPTAGLGDDEGTIEFWMSPQFDLREARDFTGIATMQSEPFAAGFKTSLLVSYSQQRQIVVQINADQEEPLTSQSLNWKAGEWHHLAVSWGREGTRLYVDGRMTARNRRGDPPGLIAPDIVLGNHTWTLLSGRVSNTAIDEFRLSSIQRSDRDIETSARATSPLQPDSQTLVLEHFDGTPAPPLMLAEDSAAYNARPAMTRATWNVVASNPFPAGATLSYTVTTATGAVVARGDTAAPGGQSRAQIAVPPIEAPGFYRIRLRLERGGVAMNVGEDWVRVTSRQPGAARNSESRLFGASASAVDSVDHEEFFRRAAAAGVTSVRIPFEWAQIEPRNNEFVWARYDQIVSWAIKHRIEIVPTLFWENPQPAWAGRGKASATSDNIHPPENMREWEDFVSRTVTRYKDRITWWIPLNEPNLVRYWHPRPDPKAYAALLKTSAAAVRRADPDARILGLSTSGVDLRFIEEAFQAGALDASDAIGIHPYRAPNGPDQRVPINILDPGSTPGTFLDGIRAVRRLMDKYGGGSKKIWLDEVGQPYRDDFIVPNWAVPEAAAADYLSKTYVESMASGDIDRVLWYAFWGAEYGSFSLLTPDGKPTLPFVAYAAAAERLGGVSYTSDGNRGANIRSLRFTGPGESLEVVWSLKGSSELALQPGERAYDVYGYPISGRALKLTTSPVFVERAH
jgi:hypothetical protein